MMPEIYQVMAAVKPPGTPDLGDRFEALHSIMFGARALCEGISKGLGQEAD